MGAALKAYPTRTANGTTKSKARNAHHAPPRARFHI